MNVGTTYVFDGKKVTCKGEISREEAKSYLDRGIGLYGHRLIGVSAAVDEQDPAYVCLTYELEDRPFHRIRRITGYLVGTLDRFNNGKRSEERDRVKHGMQEAGR